MNFILPRRCACQCLSQRLQRQQHCVEATVWFVMFQHSRVFGVDVTVWFAMFRHCRVFSCSDYTTLIHMTVWFVIFKHSRLITVDCSVFSQESQRSISRHLDHPLLMWLERYTIYWLVDETVICEVSTLYRAISHWLVTTPAKLSKNNIPFSLELT